MKTFHIKCTEDYITPLAIKESATTMVPENTVLMVTRSGILRHSIPVSICDVPVCINQDIKGFIVINKNINNKYFAYCIHGCQSPLLTGWRQQGATVESLNTEKIKTSLVSLPPLFEQKLIVAYLDRETAKIDALIAKKQELIERLKEKRAALITRVVTRGLPPDAARKAGLDPNPKLKDSGVEWLGNVPQHWNLNKLKHLCRFISGMTPTKDDKSYWNGDMPWVSPKDMKLKYIYDTEDKISQNALIDFNIKIIDIGKLLIVVRGMILSHSLPVAITKVESTINQDMKAIYFIEEIKIEYIYYYFVGLSKLILSNIIEESGHGTKVIRMDNLNSLIIPYPNNNEQDIYLNYLNKQCDEYDKLILNVLSAISKLRELRSALITAAVTGQIDVREEVA